jgi:dephospho-CoA kinase
VKPILGLIGAIGAGKSTVAEHLTTRGGYLVDADKLGHAVLEEAEVKAELLNRWGEQILNIQGGINRKAVGAIVFADPAERQALEAIMFPRIQAREKELFKLANTDPTVRFIILDAAVLLEAGHGPICTKILFVDAPWLQRVERVRNRSGWTEEELRRREAAQMSLTEKRQRADAIIMNDGSLVELHRKIDHILQDWGLLPTTLTQGRTP